MQYVFIFPSTTSHNTVGLSMESSPFSRLCTAIHDAKLLVAELHLTRCIEPGAGGLFEITDLLPFHRPSCICLADPGCKTTTSLS